MFIPPSFEPNGPSEPQWFPRPITDAIESSLDLLERLEEDKKRRLRAIANVAARTPIGLGGVEDAAARPTSNLSPKASAPASNNYSRYRYYPPPSEDSASLHTSYRRSERLCATTPASVTTRNRHYRRGTTPRSTASTSTAMDGTARAGARTPLDGIGSATPSVSDRAYMDDSRDTSFRRLSSSPASFMSPPLDPRAGGGSSVKASTRRSAGGMRSPHHYRRQSREERNSYVIDTAAMPTTGEEEWVTPTAMSTTAQTPGHGQGEDVYSRRRIASQQRRRGWDERHV